MGSSFRISDNLSIRVRIDRRFLHLPRILWYQRQI